MPCMQRYLCQHICYRHHVGIHQISDSNTFRKVLRLYLASRLLKSEHLICLIGEHSRGECSHSSSLLSVGSSSSSSKSSWPSSSFLQTAETSIAVRSTCAERRWGRNSLTDTHRATIGTTRTPVSKTQTESYPWTYIMEGDSCLMNAREVILGYTYRLKWNQNGK